MSKKIEKHHKIKRQFCATMKENFIKGAKKGFGKKPPITCGAFGGKK